MRVQVREVGRTKDQRNIVGFACDAGVGSAVWRGRASPAVATNYHVEFAVNDEIVLGRTATPSGREAYSVSSRDRQTFLTGVVERIDEDGMAYFRLSQDCLIMIQSIGVRPGAWLTLTLAVESIEMYDYDL
jgi:hypothetical protein